MLAASYLSRFSHHLTWPYGPHYVVVENGWLHSGDLGLKHSDGYIEVKDRAKDTSHQEERIGRPQGNTEAFAQGQSERIGAIEAQQVIAAVCTYVRSSPKPVPAEIPQIAAGHLSC
ncbi:hypothetical protein J5N97_017852 [Dioscorea zingiberensis]|uniref:Uncharacterized protein n=1 Tax=Dioscorea zingiberensis TaxID=325984 RepID=A0A9D5HH36_9LILI|nr:hypothetical protein J5N97_017852 [Dioscorea zingiberensis]